MTWIIAIFLLLIAIYAFNAPKHITSKSLWQDLLRLCHGDEALARRLVDYELQHNSRLTEEQAYRRAIQTYQRDNR